MKYSYQLFKTDIERSYTTKYAYCLSGAFYDVYSDDREHFFRPRADKESLLARREFYRTFLSKENYPVFVGPYNVVNGRTVPSEVLYQSLGLPLDVRTKKGKDGGRVPLTCEEIISRITFDPTISPDRGLGPSYPNKDELYATDFALIEARNDLISKGFFCQNTELIANPEAPSQVLYPIHVLESRIPKRYLDEKETGAKLFMDFVPFGPNKTLEVYQKYYAPLDHRTLEEKCRLAFRIVPEDTPNEEYERNQALRRYFKGIRGRIRNDYFKKNFFTYTICGFTVLDDDLGFDFTSCKHRAVGTRFNRYGGECDRILETVNGKTLERQEPVSYFFLSKDKKRIGELFDFAYKYRKKHPETGFVPAYFLKRRGLPYPAYPYVKYFDFSSGDKKAFLSLLPFSDSILTPMDLGYREPYALDDGTLCFCRQNEKDLLSVKDSQYPQLRKRTKDGIHIRHLDNKLRGDLICSYSSPKKWKNRITGNTSFFITWKALTVIQHDDVLETDFDGNLILIRKIFELRNEGNTFLESSQILGLDLSAGTTLLAYVRTTITLEAEYPEEHTETKREPVPYLFEPIKIHTEDKEYPFLFAYPFGIGFSKDGKNILFDSEAATSRFERGRLSKTGYQYRNSVRSYVGTSYEYGRVLVYDKLYPVYDEAKKRFRTEKDFIKNHLSVLYPFLESDSSLRGAVRMSLAYKDGIGFFTSGFSKCQGVEFSSRITDKVQSFCLGKDPIDFYDAVNLSGTEDYFIPSRKKRQENHIYRIYDCFGPVLESDASLTGENRFSYQLAFALEKKYWRRARGFEFDQSYLGFIRYDGREISVGRNFFAFRKEDGSYYLPLKDKPALERAYRLIRKNKITPYKDLKENSFWITRRMGLPISLAKPFYQALRKGQEPIDAIPYEDIDADTSDYPTYSTPFDCRRNQLDGEVFTTEANRRVLHRGRLVGPGNRIPESLRVKGRERPGNWPYLLYGTALVDHPSGLLKTYLIPDAVSFMDLVTEFLGQASEKGLRSPFYFKERMRHAYRENKEFLLELINAFSLGNQKWEETMDSLFGSFSLKGIKNYPKATCRERIVQFLDYVIVCSFESINDIIIKEKHEKQIRNRK